MLDDILDEIQAEQPRTPASRAGKVLHRLYPDLDLPAVEPRWRPEDKQPSHTLILSEYERHWLACRIQVHLKSYELFEWSEMKAVLQEILKRLEALKHDGTDTRTASTSGFGTTAPTNLATSQPDAPSPHAHGPGDVQSDRPEAG